MDMNNQFSQRVSDILAYSKQEANRLMNPYIGPEHILLGLIRDGGGKAVEALTQLNVNLQKVRFDIESVLKRDSDPTLQPNANVTFTPVAAKILKMCLLEARRMHMAVIDSEHILLAILHEGENPAAEALENNHISYKAVFEQLTLEPNTPVAGMGFTQDDEEDEDDIPGMGDQNKNPKQQYSSAKTAKKSANNTPVLDNFGIDITQAAAEGRLDPVVGREKEIERVAQILGRRKKNNPILIGEPGVGKSAIVEGLATRIVQKKVSRVLFNKKVIMLDMAAVVAGTKYRGQFEERMRSIINELKKNPDIIVFIDEIHTIIGAGGVAGSMDAANMLKPALARGEFQCIGATTTDEYRRSIEKDGALERRFQKVQVEPTTVEETLQILQNIKGKYEEHHNVSYTDAALQACVKLADRYINDRHFPDKAIDAMDEAGSRAHLSNITVPKEIEEQEKSIEEIHRLKDEAVVSQNYELAAGYRDKGKEMAEKLEQMKTEWENGMKEHRAVVDEDAIADVVSMMSGVPVQRMAQTEEVKLAGMKEQLQSQVIAQDAAIEKLTRAILRSRVGLKDPNHPIGTFLFLGPTGVGKTYLSQQLAKFMFGSADALIRIDMSEYTDKFTTSKLIGAPPGYVGYDEGGQLTERVRRKPYSIVLLDEIEKAHPAIFNLLLQVMDEGRLTDSYGKTVDFKNTILIMTSNIGTKQLKEFGRGIGFTTTNDITNRDYANSVIKKALDKQFAPEFLNRIDEIINFDQLSEEALLRIAQLELDKLSRRLEVIGYKLDISDEAKKFIAKKGYDVQFGARPLKRAIQSHVEDGLSEMIVESGIKPGCTISVGYDPEKDALTFIKV